MSDDMPHITAPPPAFESDIHKHTHPSSPKRRDRHQFSSSEQYNRKSEDKYNTTAMDTVDIEPPVYAKIADSAKKEKVEQRPRGWASRRYPSHDLESGTSGSEAMASPGARHYSTREMPVYDDQYFYKYGKQPQMSRWQKSEMKYRHWLETMTQRRRTKLVFQMMLAGMIVGILLGLAFGISDD
ncbi:hypothetical protein MGYG_03065 [Nannizzia gypsea CBS 118893]|uniref:Uncharacterized protein n=1 Tax=Arthroderma gypseum (strain ATCC MYA-4604 / CBS 118893) TaxID=535722 RepID=E4UQP1_ARTGP|nr:hypothetical protein MGYG_03065 [Nannizzia gypsea CBS 118893]EFR00059.1 hypothetical protein MGYG_03065 [Nannizzia gypsea CBS 118893]